MNNMNTHYDNLWTAAVYYGAELQTVKAVEELGELLTLLGRAMTERGITRAELIGEVADCYNMLDQLCILHDMEDDVEQVAEEKMLRLVDKLCADEEKEE